MISSLRTLFACSLLLAACGDSYTPTVPISGRISGLEGTGLMLRNNGGDDRMVGSTDRTFELATPVAYGATYDVTVESQPTSPSQVCTVTGGSGTVTSVEPIRDVTVTCATRTFPVSGTVGGLLGTGLTLQNNGGDDLAVSADGTFAFAAPVASGAAFAVTVATQPSGPTQTCTVAGGTGTIGAAGVSTVVVDCATDRFVVGGTAAGLAGTVQLQNNGGDDITVTANGSFAFPASIASGEAYAVAITAQPTVPSQTCTLANATGTVVDADVTSVALACTTNTFAVGGTVSGLAGSGLVVQINGGETHAVTGDGAFAFPTPIASGAPYTVEIVTQPTLPTQACTVMSPSGIVGAADVTTVQIACSTTRFAIGGTVSGLAGGGLVLRDNNGDDLAVAANGAFAFATPIASGATYAVTVHAQPANPSQTCAVAGGTGTVGGGDVTTVVVSCVTNQFTVGGTITGLAGTVELTNNGHTITRAANGAFDFPSQLDGTAYAVTVTAHPASPSQTCTVASGTGTLAGAAVTDVAVTCVTNSFTVGGTVSGLAAGEAVVLRNNGGDDRTVSDDGAFAFATPVASGAAYAVTVLTAPAGKQCTVANASGTVGAAAITDVAVSCSASLTRWSDGTMAWPDQACNPTSSFGGCNTNDQAHADAWASYVCQQNGFASGVWTGNKIAGCSGEISMYCQGNIPCTPQYETTCFASDQTRIELTCFR